VRRHSEPNGFFNRKVAWGKTWQEDLGKQYLDEKGQQVYIGRRLQDSTLGKDKEGKTSIAASRSRQTEMI